MGFRIIDGIGYESNMSSTSYVVSTWHENGVLERSVRPSIDWVEVGPCPPLDQLDPVRDAQLIAEKAADALKRSARRAKTTCRRLIQSSGLMELLTITYRQNQPDRDLCKKHFKEWVRRMKKALGGTFTYVASFERQERGSMHVHLACHKLPRHVEHKGVKIQSWRLGTEIWRSIVGKDNGLCFVGGKTRFGSPQGKTQSLAKIAQYVSKYILKDYEQFPSGSNRYSRSDTLELQKPTRITLTGTFAQIIDVTFEIPEGYTVRDHALPGKYKDCVWLMCEKIHR
jgi:hypothetical protein